jgi:DNA-binding SARP family transcriptional activator/predicted ATPase/predicted negative regulator of RcsB-dependent stress response
VAQLHLTTLGRLDISYAGEPLPAERVSAKGQALLVYLALTRQPASRSALAGLLWGDMTEEAARANLRATLSKLRRLLPESVLYISRLHIALEPGSYRLDAALLEAAAPSTSSLHEAERLYPGPFLHQFDLPNAPDFDEWAAAQRQRLHQLALSALYRHAATALAGPDPSAGIPTARRLLQLEPWHEEGHRLLMELLARNGQRTLALAQFETLRNSLREELGVDPAPETVALHAAIRDGTIAPVASPAPPPAAAAPPPAPRHNLPPPLTPFFGRDAERARLAGRLQGETYRLVTLCGEGGAGKTRLAIEAARDLLEGGPFPGGVWFVPLAGLDPAPFAGDAGALEGAIATAIAAAMGLPFATAAPPQEQLLHALRRRRCLLLLDNFEHVAAGAGLLLSLLSTAPGVTILATSRAPLHLQAEYLLRLDGLPVPPEDAAGAETSDSVRLFAERAERAAGRPILDDSTLPAIAAICRFSGGLPLAIELAAAGARWLPPYAILAMLQEHLDALATTMADVDPRHRSLRAVFDYSWQLLTPAEQEALAQLSVFHGSFRLDAAQAIAGAAPPTLFALLDKSLLQHRDAERFGLHQLLRQYAAGRLAGLPLDEAALHERHAAFYLGLAGDQAAAMRGPAPQEALRRLQAEAANLDAAWRHAAARPLPHLLARAAAGMGAFWEYAGLYAAGEEALARAIAALEAAPHAPDPALLAGPALLAHLHAARAGLLFELNRLDASEAAASAAAANGSQAGDHSLAAAAYLRLGNVAWRRGHYEEASDALQQAEAFAQAARDHGLHGTVLRSLAAVFWRQGDLAQARRTCQRSLELLQAARDVRGEARSRHFLAILALNQQDYPAAQRQLEPLLQLARATGERRVEMSAYAELAQLAAQRGQVEQALAYFAQEYELASELGVPWQLASNRGNGGDLLQRLGDLAGARDSYEEALARFRELGSAQGEANVLAFTGLLAWREEAFREGEAACRAALARAQEASARREMALARAFLAHNLAGQGRWPEAAETYATAAAAWEQLGEPGRLLEATAGQALAALHRGDLPAALALVESLLPALQSGPPPGADEPFFLYLACYEVLQAAGDDRAAPLLAAARDELQRRAAALASPALLRAYLETIPTHRALLAAHP